MKYVIAFAVMMSGLLCFAGHAAAADYILTYTRTYHEKPDDSMYAGTGIGLTGDMNFEVKGEIPVTVTWDSADGEYRGHIAGQGKETVTVRSGTTVTTWPAPQARTCTRKWDAAGQDYAMTLTGETTSDGPNMAHFVISFTDDGDTSYPFTQTCVPPDTEAGGAQKDDTYEGLGDYGFDMRLEDGATLKIDDSNGAVGHLAKKDKDVIVFHINRPGKKPVEAVAPPEKLPPEPKLPPPEKAPGCAEVVNDPAKADEMNDLFKGMPASFDSNIEDYTGVEAAVRGMLADDRKLLAGYEKTLEQVKAGLATAVQQADDPNTDPEVANQRSLQKAYEQAIEMAHKEIDRLEKCILPLLQEVVAHMQADKAQFLQLTANNGAAGSATRMKICELVQEFYAYQAGIYAMFASRCGAGASLPEIP